MKPSWDEAPDWANFMPIDAGEMSELAGAACRQRMNLGHGPKGAR